MFKNQWALSVLLFLAGFHWNCGIIPTAVWLWKFFANYRPSKMLLSNNNLRLIYRMHATNAYYYNSLVKNISERVNKTSVSEIAAKFNQSHVSFSKYQLIIECLLTQETRDRFILAANSKFWNLKLYNHIFNYLILS